MYRIIKRLKREADTHTIKRYLRRNNVEFDGIPLLSGDWPSINNEGRFSMGANCMLLSFRLRQNITIHKDAELIIGHTTGLNDGVNVCSTQSIRIGNNVKIGDMTYIYDTNFHQLSPENATKQAPVFIGDNVWIGIKSIILPGSVIGDHSIIAAGSVVTGEIPAKSLAAGSPARVIKTLDIPDGWIRT
jgi:acetyltransferase-like isoleucine patch superfamily enzyme